MTRFLTIFLTLFSVFPRFYPGLNRPQDFNKYHITGMADKEWGGILGIASGKCP